MLKEEKSSRREKMPLAPDVALEKKKTNGIREKGLMYVCMCAYVLSGDLFMSDKLERWVSEFWNAQISIIHWRAEYHRPSDPTEVCLACRPGGQIFGYLSSPGKISECLVNSLVALSVISVGDGIFEHRVWQCQSLWTASDRGIFKVFIPTEQLY